MSIRSTESLQEENASLIAWNRERADEIDTLKAENARLVATLKWVGEQVDRMGYSQTAAPLNELVKRVVDDNKLMSNVLGERAEEVARLVAERDEFKAMAQVEFGKRRASEMDVETAQARIAELELALEEVDNLYPNIPVVVRMLVGQGA